MFHKIVQVINKKVWNMSLCLNINFHFKVNFREHVVRSTQNHQIIPIEISSKYFFSVFFSVLSTSKQKI